MKKSEVIPQFYGGWNGERDEELVGCGIIEGRLPQDAAAEPPWTGSRRVFDYPAAH